ncbi:MAG TPA: DUF433 domain-containing protein [Hanamia sp.]|nr:DUF433 domain-containing protein [Hanamia sp.]
MNIPDLIISNPEILGGQPVFKGTRVPVSNLIEYIESGFTVNDFLEGFPTVKKSQVKQVLNLLSKHILQVAKAQNTTRRTLRRKTKTVV